jgi:hypothetical protein
MHRRGYYRVPKKCPANRIDGIFAGIIQAKFAEGWPKARIAREFWLNRRTAPSNSCAEPNLHWKEFVCLKRGSDNYAKEWNESGQELQRKLALEYGELQDMERQIKLVTLNICVTK